MVVTMADSPRPGVWALEKSMDGGKTWTAWQYFAGNDPGTVIIQHSIRFVLTGSTLPATIHVQLYNIVAAF